MDRELSGGRRLWPLAAYGAMVLGAFALFLLVRRYGETLTAPAPAAIDTTGSAAAVSDPNTLLHVLVALAAVVVAGRLLGRLFTRIGQPPVIGEVIAGILLGPSLLGRIAPDVAAYVLPPSVAPFLGVIAQLGVMLYMFMVGLQLNAGLLRSLRMGHRQLPDHLEESGDRPVRHPEGLLPRGVRRGNGRDGLAHRARGDPVLVYAGHLRKRRPRGARDAGHHLHARLRPGHRQRALATVGQLRNHDSHADRRPRPDHRHQRVPPSTADLRHQAGGHGRHHAQRRPDAESVHRLEHVPWRTLHPHAGHLRRAALRAGGINGVLAAYNVRTGERVYQARVGNSGSFSASPVAADGKIYVASEDGDVFVVKAGPAYELLATNAIGQILMATPAISSGVIIIRGLKDVFAIGQKR